MLGRLFKRRTNRLDQAAHRIQKVVQDFASMVERIDPMTYYDEKLLPHPKSEIAECLLVSIGLARSDAERQKALAIVLLSLARFQEGVGMTPVSAFPQEAAALLQARKAGALSEEALVSAIAQSAGKVDQIKLSDLQTRERQELEHYQAMIGRFSS